jgi:hypothetical protein
MKDEKSGPVISLAYAFLRFPIQPSAGAFVLNRSHNGVFRGNQCQSARLLLYRKREHSARFAKVNFMVRKVEWMRSVHPIENQ